MSRVCPCFSYVCLYLYCVCSFLYVFMFLLIPLILFNNPIQYTTLQERTSQCSSTTTQVNPFQGQYNPLHYIPQQENKKQYRETATAFDRIRSQSLREKEGRRFFASCFFLCIIFFCDIAPNLRLVFLVWFFPFILITYCDKV